MYNSTINHESNYSFHSTHSFVVNWFFTCLETCQGIVGVCLLAMAPLQGQPVFSLVCFAQELKKLGCNQSFVMGLGILLNGLH